MKGLYHLRYKITPEEKGVARGEIHDEEGEGGCDAALFASIIYPDDGGLSVAWVGVDGRTAGELSPRTTLTAWSMLAEQLSGSLWLDDEEQKVCRDAFEGIRALILERRARDVQV